MRSTTQRCRPPRAPDSTPGGRSAPCCRAAAAAGSGDSRRRCRRAAWPAAAGSSPRTHHRRDCVHQRFQQQCVVGGPRTRRSPPAARQRRSAGETSRRRCRGQPGSDRSAPPGRSYRHAVHPGPGPVDRAIVTEPVQQPSVQRRPHPAACPVRSRRPQVTGLPPPSSCAGRSRQGTPVRSSETMPPVPRPVPDPRPPAPRLWPLGRQQRFDRLPQLIRPQLLSSVQRPAAGRIPRHRTQPDTQPRGCETRSY